MDTTKTPAPPKDPEALRKKILADPNTAKIAENLGVPLEDYVQQVLHFALHPNEEPSLYVVEDEALRKMGFEPPDADAMGQYMIDAATAAGAAAGKTEFVDSQPKKQPVHLPDTREPTVASDKEDPQLKAELGKRLAGRGQQG